MRNAPKLAIAASLLSIPLIGAVSASAAAPDGSYNFKPTNSQGNCVGYYSSDISQNGQFVGGNHGGESLDQTTTPGSRAAAVHAAQALSC